MSSSEERSLLHMIQAFIADVLKHVEAQLPDHVETLTLGRIIYRGQLDERTFGVRLTVGFFEDDMWPHIDAHIEVSGTEQVTLDVHPDRTPSEHAKLIVEHLLTKLSPAS